MEGLRLAWFFSISSMFSLIESSFIFTFLFILTFFNFHSIKCEQIKDINSALKYFRSNQQKIYLITGSLYLIGKIRGKLL